MRSYLNKLKRYLLDPSVELFFSLFREGCVIHGLSDQRIAELFSASKSTANRWKSGQSAPAKKYRELVILKLMDITYQSLKSDR